MKSMKKKRREDQMQINIRHFPHVYWQKYYIGTFKGEKGPSYLFENILL